MTRQINTLRSEITGDLPPAVTGRKPQPFSERFWRNVDIRQKEECWPWVGHRNFGGYGTIVVRFITPDGYRVARSMIASRVSWELHYGEIPPGVHVLHKCDNPPCVNPHHLILGSHTENMRQAANKGHLGPTHLLLTNEQVTKMREEYAASPSVSVGIIARRYAINHEHARQILMGRSYRLAGGPIGAIKPQRGQIVRTAKLTEAMVLDILMFHKSGTHRKDIAKRFNVSPASVWAITTGKHWKHVPRPS